LGTEEILNDFALKALSKGQDIILILNSLTAQTYPLWLMREESDDISRRALKTGEEPMQG
jgi:hypothetical protein